MSNVIETGIFIFLIINREKYIFKNVLNNISGPNIKNFILILFLKFILKLKKSNILDWIIYYIIIFFIFRHKIWKRF
jgi:hypothetical protein